MRPVGRNVPSVHHRQVLRRKGSQIRTSARRTSASWSLDAMYRGSALQTRSTCQYHVRERYIREGSLVPGALVLLPFRGALVAGSTPVAPDTLAATWNTWTQRTCISTPVITTVPFPHSRSSLLAPGTPWVTRADADGTHNWTACGSATFYAPGSTRPTPLLPLPRGLPHRAGVPTRVPLQLDQP